MTDNNGRGTDKLTALVTTTLSSFLTASISSSINIALPSIGREFSMDAVLLSWVATSFLLSAAMFLVPMGRIADIYGRKRIFLYGVSIFTLGALLSALATSGTELIIFRVLQGIGSAMIFATGIAIVTSAYPLGERGKALGINVASVYLGLSIGPFLGGILTQSFGWRSIFIVNLPLGVIVILMVLLRLKGEWAEAGGEKLDYAGSFIFGFVLVALMYGFTLLPSLSGLILIVSAIAGLILFVWWEGRVKNPVLNMSLFRNNVVFAFSNLAALINYSATSAVAFLFSLYLQYVKGLTPREAGLVLVAQPVIMAVVSPLAGKLSDKVEPRILASAGMSIIVIGLGILSFIAETTDIYLIVMGLMLLGLGFALFSSPNTNAIMSSVEKRYYGIASATMATMRLTGQMLSMGISILIFSLVIGKVKLTAEYHAELLSSIKTALVIFSVLCFAGVFASLARGKMR